MTSTVVGDPAPIRVPNCTPADKDRPDARSLAHDWKHSGEAPNHADVYRCRRCDATSSD